jgi:hypothetical protein
MNDKSESSQGEAKQGRGILISVRLAIDDIDRLKQAFAAGELERLGITSISFPAEEDRKWIEKERDDKDNQSNAAKSPRL